MHGVYSLFLKIGPCTALFPVTFISSSKKNPHYTTHIIMNVTDTHTEMLARRIDMWPYWALAHRAVRLWKAHVSPYGCSQRTIPDESPDLTLSEPVINEQWAWLFCLFRPLVSDIVPLKSSPEVSAIKT